MTINIDELKKKIIYRSNYRGTKEMDKLLGTFTKKNINNLAEFLNKRPENITAWRLFLLSCCFLASYFFSTWCT